MIRPATSQDAEAIASIYNHYVLHTHSSFETEAVSREEMAARIDRVLNEYGLPWLVYDHAGELQGYSYATQWKPRKAYGNTVESSVYLDPSHHGKGLGTQLYKALIESLIELKCHAALGGISLPNDPSIALHEKLGFVKVGQLREVGFKNNQWVDVGYWELILTNSK